MNKFWAWVFLVAAGALTLLFFSNDFGLIDIQKTAIVAAIGIDTSEETEGQWSVTAQIAVPDANAGKASNISIPSAETMGAGIAEVNRKTGWYPTLVHCRLILLGEKVAEDDVFRVLGYFLRSEYVEDSCLVAVCEGRAQDMLGAASPVGELTALAIAKVLSSEAQKTGLVCVTNLRDFAKGYYARAKSGYLPFLSLLREAKNESGGAGSSSGGAGASDGSGNASGGGAGGAGKNADVFDAPRTGECGALSSVTLWHLFPPRGREGYGTDPAQQRNTGAAFGVNAEWKSGCRTPCACPRAGSPRRGRSPAGGCATASV